MLKAAPSFDLTPRDNPEPAVHSSELLKVPVDVEVQAYKMFLEKGLGLETIALQFQLPYPTVAHWATANKWLEHKEEVQKTLVREEELRYREQVIKARTAVLGRHLEVAETIESKIQEAVDNMDMTDPKAIGKLKSAAEALNASSAVSARAAAITDRPFSGPQGEAKVQVFVMGGGEVRHSPAYAEDVESRRV